MITARTWLTEAESELKRAGISSYRLDGQLLLAHVTGLSRTNLLANPETELSREQIKAFKALLAQRLNRVPLVHLTGHTEFYGLELAITPDVLTPRTETEAMVRWASQYLPRGAKVLDMGTGSGALATALAVTRPDLRVSASDCSVAALKVAGRNAKHHGVNLTLVKSDIWDDIAGHFDAVLTNLPYLEDDAELLPEVAREPAVALFGGPDGLNLYRRMLTGLPSHLNSAGYLFTECDPWQQPRLIAAAGEVGLERIEQDYFILGFQKKSAG